MDVCSYYTEEQDCWSWSRPKAIALTGAVSESNLESVEFCRLRLKPGVVDFVLSMDDNSCRIMMHSLENTGIKAALEEKERSNT